MAQTSFRFSPLAFALPRVGTYLNRPPRLSALLANIRLYYKYTPKQGILTEGGRLSTVDLLIKVAYFAKQKINKIFS